MVWDLMVTFALNVKQVLLRAKSMIGLSKFVVDPHGAVLNQLVRAHMVWDQLYGVD
jgi:hypothetical protein